MHGRVLVLGVCTTQCMCQACVAECACLAYARPSAWALGVCTAECMAEWHGLAVRDDGLDGRTVRRFVRLGLDIRFARLGWARDSVGRGARLGRDASTVRPRRTDWLHMG